MGQGPRTVMAQIAAEELGLSSELSARPRRRHALHALRPLHRGEPLDDGRRAGGQARRRGGRRAPARDRRRAVGRRSRRWSSCVDGRRRLRRRGDLLPGPDRQALRLPRRGDHRGRRGSPDRRRDRLLRRGPALLGGVRRRRRGRGRSRHRRRSRCCARPPSPTSARRSTPSSSSARTRARRCRGSATRCSRRCGSSTARWSTTTCSSTASRAIADLPGSMTSIIVENADGPGPYGAKGCGEGALAAVPGGDRLRARRRRRRDERAAADPRARLARGSQEQRLTTDKRPGRRPYE